MKTVAILGAGISGLSLAWFLSERCKVLVFEQSPQVGGWIQTRREGKALFECGPRSLRTVGSGVEIVTLLEELGLQDAVIESSLDAKRRYIVQQGELCLVPFSMKLAPLFCFGVLKDLLLPQGEYQEQTVSDFFIHRFGKSFHDTFVEPLCAGIYAAGPQFLSMQSTFGSLLKSRSAVLSMLRSTKRCEESSEWVQSKIGKILSLSHGLQMLPDTLKSKVKADVYCNTSVRGIVEGTSKVSVVTDHKTYEVDHVVSTLPASSLRTFFCDSDPVNELLGEFSSTSVVTVSLGWKDIAPIITGFGFLCSSQEERELLGIVFDSNVFVEHNGQFSVRLSVMMGGTRAREMLNLDERVLKEKALGFVKKYLHIAAHPDFCSVQKAKNAIGLYTLGHKARCERISQIVNQRRISILGASFTGVSVGDCIQSARSLYKKTLLHLM